MLKQFIDLKNVLSSSGFVVFFFVVLFLSLFPSWHLLGGFLSALVVTVMFYCSLQ